MFPTFRKTEAPTDALVNRILDLEKKRLQKLENFDIAALEKRLKELEVEVHGPHRDGQFSEGKDKHHSVSQTDTKISDVSKTNKLSTTMGESNERKSEHDMNHHGDMKEKGGVAHSSPSVSTPTPGGRSVSQDHSYRMSWNQPKLSPFLGASSATTVLTTPTVSKETKHMSLPVRRPSQNAQSPLDDDLHSGTSTNTVSTTATSTVTASTTAAWRQSTSIYPLPSTSTTAALHSTQNMHILEDFAKLERERDELLSTSPSVLEFCILEADWNKVLQLAVNHFTQVTAAFMSSSPLPSQRKSFAIPTDIQSQMIFDPMVLMQKYPTIPSYCTYYYPSSSSSTVGASLNPLNFSAAQHSLSASETIQKIQEQHLMFPSGIPIEIVSSTVMKYRLFGMTNTRSDYRQANNTRRYTTSQRHIIPFSNTTGHAQYACCYVTYQAYPVEEFLELFDSFGMDEVTEGQQEESTQNESLARETIVNKTERLVGKNAGKLILKYIYERHQQQLACSVIQRAFRNYQRIKRENIWYGRKPTSNHTGTKSTMSGTNSEIGQSSKSVPNTPNRTSVINILSPMGMLGGSNGNSNANTNANAKSTGIFSRLFRRSLAEESSHLGTDGSTHGSVHSDSEQSAAAVTTPTKYRFGSLTNTKGDTVGTPTSSKLDRIGSTDSMPTADDGPIPINFEAAGGNSSIQQLSSIPEECNDEGNDKVPTIAENHITEEEKEFKRMEEEMEGFPTPFVPFSRERMKTKDIFKVLKGKYILTQKAYCMVTPLQEFPFIFQMLDAMIEAEKPIINRSTAGNELVKTPINPSATVFTTTSISPSQPVVKTNVGHLRHKFLDQVHVLLLQDVASTFTGHNNNTPNQPGSFNSSNIAMTLQDLMSNFSLSKHRYYNTSNRILTKYMHRYQHRCEDGPSSNVSISAPKVSDVPKSNTSTNLDDTTTTSSSAAAVLESQGDEETKANGVVSSSSKTIEPQDEFGNPLIRELEVDIDDDDEDDAMFGMNSKEKKLAKASAASTARPQLPKKKKKKTYHVLRVPGYTNRHQAQPGHISNTNNKVEREKEEVNRVIQSTGGVVVDFDTMLNNKDWCAMLAFLHIPENLFFKILNLLLMEKSLIITGAHSGIISSITLGILYLLQPFQWEGICVPLLPDSATELFGAPIPYVIGTVKKPSTQDMSDYPTTAILCLNDDTVQMTYYYPPKIPKQLSLQTEEQTLDSTPGSKKRASFYKHRQQSASSTSKAPETPSAASVPINALTPAAAALLAATNQEINVPLLTSLYSLPPLLPTNDAPSSSGGVSAMIDYGNRSYRYVKVVDISFISWFVRLPDLPVDLPPHYDMCIRIKHFRKSLSKFLMPYLHYFIYDNQTPANTSYPSHNLQSVNKKLIQQTITIKNTTEMLLINLPLPSNLIQQCKLLVKLIKKYNFSWLLLGNSQYSNQQSSFGGIQDIYDWKRFMKSVPMTIPTMQYEADGTMKTMTVMREVFQPESFLEPMRGQLEFQEALIHTQLFTTCLDRYRQEYIFLNHIREYIAHWIYFQYLRLKKKSS